MTLHNDPPIRTILAVGEPGTWNLEIALSDIHCESSAWDLLPLDRNRLETFGLSARSVLLGSRWCRFIYTSVPTPTGVLRALAEGTRADAALLVVPVVGRAPSAPLRELRDGGVNRAVVLLDTGFPAAASDALDRAEREARLWLSENGFDGDTTLIIRGTTEGARQFRDKLGWDDSLEDDSAAYDAAYDAFEAERGGWCEVILAALDALPILRTSIAIGPLSFPGGVIFACAECGLALTRTLHEMPDPGRPGHSDRDKDYVPEGCFAVAKGAPDAPAGQVIVNQEDMIHTHLLETTATDCCGHFPNSRGEHNFGCDCGHPVAFCWKTHWLPRFVGLDPERVVRREAPPPSEVPADPVIG